MKRGQLQMDHQTWKRGVSRRLKEKWSEDDTAEAAAYRESMLNKSAELYRTERAIREALIAAAVVVPIMVFAAVAGYAMGLF